jgi:hypothetical protein
MENLEIPFMYLAPAQFLRIIPSPLRRFLSPFVWWLPHVIIMSAGGVNVNSVLEAGGFHLLPEHGLGSGRTTNIAHANE